MDCNPDRDTLMRAWISVQVAVRLLVIPAGLALVAEWLIR
jgi:hypothetical protein